MANLLNFKFGQHNNLPTSTSAGTVYITTDEQAMYIDLPVSHDESAAINRIRIGDIIVKDDLSKLGPPPYAEGAFYYIAADNALLRYNSGKWVQINSVSDVQAEFNTKMKELEDELALEIKRATDAEKEITEAVAEANKEIALRVTTEAFENYKGTNDAAVAAAKQQADLGVTNAAGALQKAQEADDAAGAAQARADSAYTLAEGKINASDLSTALNSYYTKTQVDDIASGLRGSTDKTIADAYALASKNERGLQELSNVVDGKTTMAAVQTELQSYATKQDLNDEKAALLGNASSAADSYTIYGVAKAAKNAQDKADEGVSAAANAQGKADEAYNLAEAAQTRANNAYTLAEGKITANEVDAKLAAYSTTQEMNSAISEVRGNTTATVASVESAAATAQRKAEEADSAAELAQQDVNKALFLDGSRSMTGDLNMGNKLITNLATPTAESHATTKAYVDTAIASAIGANDAMTFKGVLNVSSAGGTTAAPGNAVANRGDTYKIGKIGTYAGIACKVGDLLIYEGDDNTQDASKWTHISSGYEDDYLQKVFASTAATGININISNGVDDGAAVSSINLVGDTNSNIQFSASGNTVTATMVWGTF